MMRILTWLLSALLFLVMACSNEPSRRTPRSSSSSIALNPNVSVPGFSADSAYAYIEKQLSFGPRVPNSPGHMATANWLVEKLESFGAKVQVQTATVTAYDGTPLDMKNIIASYNPELTRRVMLSAHWDTRPMADQEEDEALHDQPIPGANDGGSGVAVLLEMARHFQRQVPTVGVDLVLWDTEDYGVSEVQDSYCLGSQYWSKNKHQPGYQATWGINLDMVGTHDARFPREGQSMTYAPFLVERVWKTAELLGYGEYFVMRRTDPIVDDHYYVSAEGGVPMIDIIDQPGGKGFFEHWHTLGDDIDAISRETLKAVGQTVMQVVYSEGVPTEPTS